MGGTILPNPPISEGPKCDLYLLKESISHMCVLLTFNPFLTASSIHKTFVFLVHLLAYAIDIEYTANFYPSMDSSGAKSVFLNISRDVVKTTPMAPLR